MRAVSRSRSARAGAGDGVFALMLLAVPLAGWRAENPAVARFEETIQPILIDYCYRCHGDGTKKGNVALDTFASGRRPPGQPGALVVGAQERARRHHAAGRKPRPSDKEVGLLADWIKRDVFGADPHDPDPGRVTIRRLNRVEYRNTVRDLTGFDFKAEEEFPPDDTGYGFDTIGDVLSVSPLLLEKYMQAAESIVAAAVPTVSRLVPEMKVTGPLDPKKWTRPRNYERFFPRDDVPRTDPERRQYAREILGRFATKAFRRPVDDRTLDRLVAIAEGIYRQPGQRFEQGVARAMVAVLASPRFVFRVEATEPKSARRRASILTLMNTPGLAALVLSLVDHARRRADPAGRARRAPQGPGAPGETNAGGRARRIAHPEFRGAVAASTRRRGIHDRHRGPCSGRTGAPGQRIDLNTDLRRAMRRETEMLFGHIAREDRSLLELIDCDYTFLNAKLAQFYGIKDVTGKEMRKVSLPKDSPRGGVLTHASILLVTSNPTRTSPVKRGQFILDNLLGTPAPPPPPDIPALEESKGEFKGKTPTVRELMALHRAKPLCNSCHARMDPLGLALENFNALGLWREKESGQPIDASGRLLTGESFHDVRDLKRILKERHRLDFYRCLTEKLLTYALGRGLDYHDVETVDQIVERVDREGGRFSALLMGVIESAPFQKRRDVATVAVGSTRTSKLNVESRVKP